MKKIITVQSPGRINIIGEHIDYNDGYVLPAAIDKTAVFHLRENGSENRVNIKAMDLTEVFSFDLTNYFPLKGGWQNYVMGVVSELQKLGAVIKGFDAEFKSDVPIGAGMSSSAALECSLAFGLNELFNLGFDKLEMVKACQMAEHNFVGIKCGIMDQFASMMGAESKVMLLDCQSLDFKYFPCELGDYQLLLLNSNVSHSLASSEYNLRRADSEEGLSIIKSNFSEVKSFRDVTMDILNECKSKMHERIFRRCHHVVTESNRVLEATESLTKKDYKRLGELIYASHDSLQNDYEVSCPELDFLVAQSKEEYYVLGSRMMGGGFGGCTINLIEKDKVAIFIDKMAKLYKNQFGIDLSPYSISIGNGAQIIK